MGLFLPPEIWTSILTHASGFPRSDTLPDPQHWTRLKAGETPHETINGSCVRCTLEEYDQTVLVAGCLVARQCHAAAVSLLYKDPVMQSEEGCVLFSRTLVERPDLAMHVRWLPILDFGDLAGLKDLPMGDLPATAFRQRYTDLTVHSKRVNSAKRAQVSLDECMCTLTLLSFLPSIQKIRLNSISFERLCKTLSPGSLPSLAAVETTSSIILDARLDARLSLSGLSSLAEAAPNILTLTLKGLKIESQDKEQTSRKGTTFAGLICLCLSDCSIAAESAESFLKMFPKVEQLDLIRSESGIMGPSFAAALAEHAPNLRDLRGIMWNSPTQHMNFENCLPRMQRLQRLWMSIQSQMTRSNPEEFAATLPNRLNHLSLMMANDGAEDYICKAIQSVAAATKRDGHLPKLKSIAVSNWYFELGGAGPVSRSFAFEEAMVAAGKAMEQNGARLVVSGRVLTRRDNYLGLQLEIRRYGHEKTGKEADDEEWMKGDQLYKYGPMARWCRRGSD